MNTRTNELKFFVSMLWRGDSEANRIVDALWVNEINARKAMHKKVAGCLPSKDPLLKHFFDLLESSNEEVGALITDLRDRKYDCVEDVVQDIRDIIDKREGSKHEKGQSSDPRKCA